MQLLSAAITGLALGAGSLSALVAAPSAASLLAVAGVTGLVLGTGLLVLTLLAWRWSAGAGSYIETQMETVGGAHDDTVTVFDDAQDDAAAV